MSNKIAITVSDVTIAYRDIKRFSIKKMMSQKNTISKSNIFEAVKNVSFEVKKGEILGICGKNGSGKSTLLRGIAGIFSPDAGSIDLHDNSISLLSIGVGFQRSLTGHENIYLSGMLLGFSKEEISEKYEEIVEFSELGEFINKPVGSYSSGMYSKLAFSITAILETDIILIDEVFSVGDVKFKQKSYNRMKSLIDDAKRTVIIVSHSSNSLIDLCERVVWMHDGVIKEVGDSKTVVNNYEEFMKK